MTRATAIALCVSMSACAIDPSKSGRAALDRGDEAEAIRLLTRASERRPGDANVWRDLARAQLRQRELAGARQSIAHAVALRPLATDVLLLHAQIDFANGLRATAMAHARNVAARSDNARELQEVAIVLLRLGARDEAIAAAKRSVSASRGAAATYANLAVLAVEAERIDVARAALQEGHARYPNDVALLQTYAAFLVMTGQTERAREMYGKLLPLHADPAVVHQALALLAHARGDFAQAEYHAASAVRLGGNRRADAHYTYVVVLRARGLRRQAEQALQQALNRFPHDASLRSLDESTLATSPQP